MLTMPYVTQQRIGRGANGVVDLALDPAGRPVALKHLHLHGSRREMDAARLRLRREAQALSVLRHPHIVELLDVVEHDDEVVLVMPFMAGGTLADLVASKGPLTPAQVSTLADTLLDALATAHRSGVVHRDIKPGNILFDGMGRAYLADFGVASLRDATSGLTATGSMIGTPDFMAPEQARGEKAGAASDVFALGATLLFAATGRSPYGTNDPRVTIQRAAQGRLAPIPRELDPELRRRIVPMLHRNPERRPSAAAAAGGAAGTLVRSARRGDRASWALVGAATLAMVVVAVAAVIGGRAAWDRVSAASSPLEVVAPPVEPACTDLPFQPCGQEPAPNTDGSACLAGFADYDGDASNGCEAAPDLLDGTVFEATISTANLVPGDDVDSYPTPVETEFSVFCSNAFRIELTAPAGTSMRLTVLDEGGAPLGTTVSSDMEAASISLSGSAADCWFGADDVVLTTQVAWEGPERSSSPYRLARYGSF